MKYQGAGIVVFRSHLKEHQCVIVRQCRTNYGFPKGGMEGTETIIETAIRELFEETGLQVGEEVELFATPPFVEHNRRRNINVAYFVGQLKSTHQDPLLVWDPFELDGVCWMSIGLAHSVLLPMRQEILAKTYAFWTTTKLNSNGPARSLQRAARRVWLSKTLSWILRYKLKDPSLNLKVEEDKWVEMEELLRKVPALGSQNVSVEEICHLVDTSPSIHFERRDNSIRACPWQIKWQPLSSADAPTSCWYSTTLCRWEQIEKAGGIRSLHQYIYFDTARWTNPGIIKIRVSLQRAILEQNYRCQKSIMHPETIRLRWHPKNGLFPLKYLAFSPLSPLSKVDHIDDHTTWTMSVPLG